MPPRIIPRVSGVMMKCWTFLAAVFAACGIDAQAAEVLYAASVRSTPGDDSQRVAGHLYTFDLSTRVFSLVGPLRAGGRPIGVTGLADHPQTGELFGITAESSPNFPSSLVAIDVSSGDARVIGALRAIGSDIAFDPEGRLHVWMRETSQLARVDLSTGKATPIGDARGAGQTGGLGIDAAGRVYVAASGATGTLDMVDRTTGAISKGPGLRGAPYPAGINSLSISPAGVIFAVNTNLGSPANTVLVKIDARDGTVTQLGPLPNDTDALVFMPGAPGQRATLMIAGLVVVVIAIASFMVARRRRRAASAGKA